MAREEAARIELERQAKIKRDEEEKLERKKVISLHFSSTRRSVNADLVYYLVDLKLQWT